MRSWHVKQRLRWRQHCKTLCHWSKEEKSLCATYGTLFKPWPNESESWREVKLSLSFGQELPSTLGYSHRIWTCSNFSWQLARVLSRSAAHESFSESYAVSNYCFFPAGLDRKGKIIWRRTRGPRTTPMLFKKSAVTGKFLHQLTCTRQDFASGMFPPKTITCNKEVTAKKHKH